MIRGGVGNASRSPIAMHCRSYRLVSTHHIITARRHLTQSSTSHGLFGFGRSSSTDKKILLTPEDIFPPAAQNAHSLVRELRTQDPLDRIRCLEPALGSNEPFGDLNDRCLNAQPDTIQAHLVPFWTVITFSSHRWHLINATDGGTETLPRGENNSDVSFSVAAVDKDHWCRDVILTDGVRRMHELIMSNGAGGLGAGMVFPIAQEQPDEFLPAIWNHLYKDHRFLPTECAPFARSYPKLPDDALKSALEQASYEIFIDQGFYPKASVSAPTHYRAFPTYRVVYKAAFSNRTEYWDGWYRKPPYSSFTGKFGASHHFPLAQTGPKLSDQCHSRDEPNTPFSIVHHNPFGGPKKDADELIWNRGFAQDPLHIPFAERILATMKDGPVDWQDPDILALTPVNLHNVVKYGTERIIDAPTSPCPRAFKPKPTANTGTRPSALKRNVVKNTRTANPTSRPNPAANTSSDHHTRPRPPPRSSIPPPRPRATAASTASTPAATPAPRDSSDFYKVLEIQPTPAFLDASREAEVNRRIAVARRTLLAMYHPDQSFGEKKEYHAKTEKATMINSAFAEVNTLEKRVSYDRRQ